MMKMKDVVTKESAPVKKKSKPSPFVILKKGEEENVDASGLFCPRCGKDTEGEIFCGNCGGNRKVMAEALRKRESEKEEI